MEDLLKLQSFLNNYLKFGKNGLVCIDDKKILFSSQEELFKMLNVSEFSDKKSIKLFNLAIESHSVLYGKIVKKKLKLSEKQFK